MNCSASQYDTQCWVIAEVARIPPVYNSRMLQPCLCLAVLIAVLAGCAAPERHTAVQWEPIEITLSSARDYDWWEFPVTARFVHSGSGRELTLEGYWTGPRAYSVRFAAPLAGAWRYETRSDDSRLNGRSGVVEVAAPEPDAISENPNLRGQIRIAAGGRTFEYADGTPFFLLADTLWAGNTARAGLGENQDGPFFEHLADRKRKNFSAVLMQMFHGFGDYPEDPTGHRNEGGHLFIDREFARLNPDFFAFTDRRWKALWERGWVVASPVCWWGKTKTCRFEPEEAERLAAYLAVRYGSFNTLWAVSGEYQYVFRDCGWSEQDLNRIGEAIQRHNPYQRPLSIHPSGQTGWPPPHGSQSSRPFHDESWLDHHWLQTGQSFDRMHYLVTRPAENRALEPVRPVFCSEAYYEHAEDPEGAYHSRWQAWTAFLNGCAGYGYGAQGMWQFRDPDDPGGEPGKPADRASPWRQAIAFQGSGQVGHVRSVLGAMSWPRLVPARDKLTVNGRPNPQVSATDISAPQAASIPGEAWIVYIPRGNAASAIEIQGVEVSSLSARWIDPRTGEASDAAPVPVSDGRAKLPPRPDPQEDWALVLRP